MFLIVSFDDEDSAEVVPESWVEGDACYWPLKWPPDKIRSYTKRQQPALRNWPLVKARVLGTAETFKRAVEKLNEASYTDHIDTTDTEIPSNSRPKRITKRPMKLMSDTESDFETDMEEQLTKKGHKVSSVPNPPLLHRNDETNNCSQPNSLSKRLTSEKSSLTRAEVLASIPPATNAGSKLYGTSAKGSAQESTAGIDELSSLSSNSHAISDGCRSPSGYESFLSDCTLPHRGRPHRLLTNDLESNPFRPSIGEDLNHMTVTDLLKYDITYQRKILGLLQELQMQSKNNALAIEGFRTQCGFSNTCIHLNRDRLKSIPRLPISNDEMLESIEAFLKIAENIHTMVVMLKDTGGCGQDDVIRRLLSRMMTNKFACNFSFTGRKGKRCFKDLKLRSIIFDAARQQPACKELTEYAFGVAVGNWLRFAPKRCRPKQHTSCGEDENMENEEI